MQTFGDTGRAQQVAPSFNLFNAKGNPVKLWDYKQRNGLVLYFLNGDELEVLHRLEGEAKTYRNHKVELLVLAGLEASQLNDLVSRTGATFPVLADRGAVVREKYLDLVSPDGFAKEHMPLAVFILDLYGAISHFQIATTPEGLPETAEIEPILEYLSYLCKP
jgi:peroxiredoxin